MQQLSAKEYTVPYPVASDVLVNHPQERPLQLKSLVNYVSDFYSIPIRNQSHEHPTPISPEGIAFGQICTVQF